ncbi:MAG TPA: hypothetical protein VLD18_15835 [Verrucomicrobiae bacterium]|jgi:hypothetical protein|nr:hypothetical protein [Verrucomicrobiae bacterium]
MNKKQLDQLILQMENYLECWKQFNHFVNIARLKKFTEEDENQFLEVKSVLAQQLELILASIECSNPTRDEVHSLISAAPSIRYLSELNDGAIRGVENQWHKIYIGWQSNLGQLKVKQREVEGQSSGFSLFGKKK